MKYCEKCMRPLEEGELCPACGILSAAPLHHIRPGTILRKKYVIGRAFDEDSMTISYLARDLSRDRVVILQEFFPAGQVIRNHLQSNTVAEAHFQEKAMERFLEKAKILSEYVQNPCIVQVMDYFRDNNTAYMVTERATGISVQHYLTKKGAIPASALLRLLEPTLRALDELHGRGLLHRKISPETIMLYPNGNIKLVDFGTATKTADLHTVNCYAPPEQYESGDHCGPWSDVYALCATLYKSITGTDPQPAQQRLVSDAVKRPSELGVDIEEKQEEILMMGMALEKTHRLQSVGAMLRALGMMREEAPAVEEVPATVRREREYKEPVVFMGMPVLEEADENVERPIDPVENHGKMSAESEPVAGQNHGPQLTIPAVMMDAAPAFEPAPAPKTAPVFDPAPAPESTPVFDPAPMPKTTPIFEPAPVPKTVPALEFEPAVHKPAYVEPTPEPGSFAAPQYEPMPAAAPEYTPWDPQVGDYDTWDVPKDNYDLWQPEVPAAPKANRKKIGLIVAIVALVVLLAGLVGLFFWLRNEKGLFGGDKEASSVSRLEELSFQLDGKRYELPVKLSKLYDNGWESDDSFDAIKAGEEVSCKLFKDGQEISVIVQNTEKEELPAEDCTVTCLYVYADEAELELDGGITTASTKKEAQEVFGEGEEDDGALYYENEDGAICLYLEQEEDNDNRISIATQGYIQSTQ